jgi:2-methylcitrate dehydratase PrpD
MPSLEDKHLTIIESIAERIAAIGYDGLPAEAVHWAKLAILDTVGVTLAGAGEPCARIAGRVLASGPETGPEIDSGEC